MIKTKAELKRMIDAGKDIRFTTTKNPFWSEIIGVERTVSSHQGNAFTLKTYRGGKWIDSWLWYKDYTVKNGIMIYKNNPDIIMEVKEA